MTYDILIFNLYDDNFNSRIILEKLCDIKITNDQYYSIIIYYLNKHDYLWKIIEPIYNARSIIIKNYFDFRVPTEDRGNFLSLKNSFGYDYNFEAHGGNAFIYTFDEKF